MQASPQADLGSRGPTARFSMRQLLPGDYQLRVEQGSVAFEDSTVSTTVTAGKTSSVTLTVPQLDGVVSGVVVDADGEPVPDAEVTIAARRGDLTEDRIFRVVARVQADAEGRFTRSELLPGDYELEVSALVGEGEGQGEGEDRPGCTGEVQVTVTASGSPAAVVPCR